MAASANRARIVAALAVAGTLGAAGWSATNGWAAPTGDTAPTGWKAGPTVSGPTVSGPTGGDSTVSGSTVAGEQSKSSPPAEEKRLNASVFRAGLKSRGLTELLELHLLEFPPADKSVSVLMLRDLKVAEFNDTTRRDRDRRAAIAEGNRFLEELIEQSPGDSRRFDWRFTLARSLLYDEAEPYFTSILYRGGTREDREELLACSTRALTVVSTLAKQLLSEQERLDTLSIRQFERLENSGYIEQLDSLAPRADYLWMWARFYDALPREDTDPVRDRRLNELLRVFDQEPEILKTPHESSKVQVQSLLLSGMACRMIKDHPAARAHFERALSVADLLDDPVELSRVQWAVDLAWVELIRNERDAGRFDEAFRAHARLRNLLAVRGGDNFGLVLVAGLLERSIHQARADRAADAGRFAESDRYRTESWQPLARMIRRELTHRDEIHATLYDLIAPNANPAELDPLEQCALIAALLFDVSRSNDQADPRLARIVEVGEMFLESADESTESLTPVVLYNLGVALHRQGRALAAARSFLEVGRAYSDFDRAPQAAAFAVELAAAVYGDAAEPTAPEIGELYLDALGVLLQAYPDSEPARYFRFYFAQLLEERGEYDRAATQYTLVDPGHEHHLQSRFLSLRCLALALRGQCDQAHADILDIRRRATDFFALHREFVSQIAPASRGDPDSDQSSAAAGLIKRARLLAGEAWVLPQIDRPLKALEVLEGFEEADPPQPALTGRVWRVRLVAFERLDRLDEATAAIPAYMAADPDGAGETLQALHMDLVAELERLRNTNDKRAIQRKAELALLVAGQIHEWASREESTSSPAKRYAVTIQLAEANLRAGRYARARELFESCLSAGDGADSKPASNDLRLLHGYAESLFMLGEFATALPMFNRLATGLAADDPLRWKSLLRDLECRTALEHPPEGIIKVIEQQKTLGSNMGGAKLFAEFEALLRENQRRIGGE